MALAPRRKEKRFIIVFLCLIAFKCRRIMLSWSTIAAYSVPVKYNVKYNVQIVIPLVRRLVSCNLLSLIYIEPKNMIQYADMWKNLFLIK